MDSGTAGQTAVDAVNDQFKKAYPNVNVEVELQQWAGVQDKLTASLATESTPDVVEIGNTLTAKYAAAGLLADLSGSVGEFGVDGDAARPDPVRRARGHPLRHPLLRRRADRRLQQEPVQGGRRRRPRPPSRSSRPSLGSCRATNAENSEYSAFYFPGKYW